MYNNQVANNYMNYPYSANPYVRQSDYGQPQMQSIMPQAGLKGRPVSSIEEVKAAQIDFDGSLFIFPDIANKKIYTKQINLNGVAELNVYEWVTQPQILTAVGDFVTKQEFEDTMSKVKDALMQIQPQEQKKEAFNF